MDIVNIEPPAELMHLVKSFWYAGAEPDDNTRSTYKLLSDGAPGMIFQHSGGHSRVFETNGTALPVSFFYGQSTGPCTNYIDGAPLVVGINFQPTALKRLFHLDASALTNRAVETEHFLPRFLIDQLLHLSAPTAIIQVLSEHFIQKSSTEKKDRIVDESISLIINNTKGVSSAVLADHASLSRRQLQRKFKEYAGVCPETYWRIIKFQRSIQLLRAGGFEKLGDVGHILGYTDQSHFGREFKLFAGYTPGDFCGTIAPRLSSTRPTTPFETVRIVKSIS